MRTITWRRGRALHYTAYSYGLYRTVNYIHISHFRLLAIQKKPKPIRVKTSRLNNIVKFIKIGIGLGLVSTHPWVKLSTHELFSVFFSQTHAPDTWPRHNIKHQLLQFDPKMCHLKVSPTWHLSWRAIPKKPILDAVTVFNILYYSLPYTSANI